MSDFYLDPSVQNIFPNGASVAPEVVATRDPTSADNQYQAGTFWFNSSAFKLWAMQGFSAGVPQWELIATSTGALDTLSDTSGTLVTPTAGGNIQIAGTTAQISVTAGSHVLTLALIGPYTPATYTLDGVLYGNGASSIGATAAGTSGQLLQSAGGASSPPAWTTATYPATATAGALIAATATNVVGQIADVAVGQVLASGGVGVIPAYTGSPSVSGSLTAATTVTATLGNVTATNGNMVMTTSGTGLVTTPVVGTPGAGPITANGRVFSATFSSISIASGATQVLVISNTSITGSGTLVSLTMSGATAGSALSIASAVSSASTLTITVTNGTSATMVTSVANITFTGIVLN